MQVPWKSVFFQRFFILLIFPLFLTPISTQDAPYLRHWPFNRHRSHSERSATSDRTRRSTDLYANFNCSVVKAFPHFSKTEVLVPKQPVEGSQLAYCRSEKTCCTPTMDHTLNDLSTQDLTDILRGATGSVLKTLKSKTLAYEKLFHKILQQSETDFNNMFTKVYGLIYERNKNIFRELFELLKSYFHRDINILKEMDLFFDILYSRMFREMNPDYPFSDDYMKCLYSNREQLNVFANIPKKIGVEVKRSFTAARTFHQALVAAAKVIEEVAGVTSTTQCSRMALQMKYCQVCRGQIGLKPCRSLCQNVMSMCFRNFALINDDWNNFVDSLLRLTNRLTTSFRVEFVVGPINVRISDAIMNYQEKSKEINEKIYANCGKPKFSKRAAFSDLPAVVSGSVPSHSYESEMPELMKDVSRKMKRTREMWSQLEYTICNDPSISVDDTESDECWNKTASGVDSSFRDRGPAYTYQRNILRQLSTRLKKITFKLEKAYHDSDIPDDSTIESAISLGSGSGDGDDESDEEDSVVQPVTNKPTPIPSNEDIMVNVSWNSVNSIPHEMKDSSVWLQSTVVMLLLPMLSMLFTEYITLKL